MAVAWHNMKERLESVLAEQDEEIRRLRQRVAELETEVNSYRPTYSPEVADYQATHGQGE